MKKEKIITPKTYVKSLIEEFKPLMYCYSGSEKLTNNYNENIAIAYAKKAVLILINKIIETEVLIDEDTYVESPSYLQYWVLCKKELLNDDELEEHPFKNLINTIKQVYPKIHESLLFDKTTDLIDLRSDFDLYKSAFKNLNYHLEVYYHKNSAEWKFKIKNKSAILFDSKHTDWCFNFELTAQIACIEHSFLLYNHFLKTQQIKNIK